MRITRGRVISGIALVGTSALVLAGCAAAPEEDGGTDAAVDFLPCMVSDAGGFDDKSFNQLGYEGLVEAAAEVGVEPITVESASETDYGPNIESLLGQGCDLIVTVGFALSAATLEAAEANPDVEFALIDDAADADFDGTPDFDNTKPIIFNTAQAAFLVGYAAASYSKTGTVATWGGMNFPTVTIFMDGFAQGVDYYNEQKGTSVQVLGWTGDAETSTFTGGFEANDVAKTTAQNFIDQGADILLPVGGPIYQSAVAAIADSGKEIALLGVDADLYETDPATQDIILTSILKGIKNATHDVVAAAAGGEFSNEAYIGTLENEGVGYAPFHNFESLVSPDLVDELDAIQGQIIDGTIPVTSYLDS
ncbi:basic membrane protein A [Microbacteriaceae bacterium SG_E_30_P1]|uniref:Basic membrane protein A n=1 Tax=Antiquaquibacter oligotrophicus TaxID=2880260 RepID=A0ABT6KRD1_9MICO|nr:BMP family ABC transporter substrate-binding protein [Antiquaquibacter oligotrophicus]MDH6181764.1 basic membrane protein A [Antiquaquibacter oligotrophicus]UDF12555.1 BMP family ABC transporter substrate-binding protein [Antiquaquibacter oligotrophicus]